MSVGAAQRGGESACAGALAARRDTEAGLSWQAGTHHPHTALRGRRADAGATAVTQGRQVSPDLGRRASRG
ncbi:hypothetical protein ACWD0J_07410, partial [Streptomyces sp. NPDC003011]